MLHGSHKHTHTHTAKPSQGEWISKVFDPMKWNRYWSETYDTSYMHAYINWNVHPISLVNRFDVIQNNTNIHTHLQCSNKNNRTKPNRRKRKKQRRKIQVNAVWPIRLHSFFCRVCVSVWVCFWLYRDCIMNWPNGAIWYECTPFVLWFQ